MLCAHFLVRCAGGLGFRLASFNCSSCADVLIVPSDFRDPEDPITKAMAITAVFETVISMIISSVSTWTTNVFEAKMCLFRMSLPGGFESS